MVLDETNKYFYEWFRHSDIGYKYIFENYILPKNNEILRENYNLIFKYDSVYYYKILEKEIKNKYDNLQLVTLYIKYDSINIIEYIVSIKDINIISLKKSLCSNYISIFGLLCKYNSYKLYDYFINIIENNNVCISNIRDKDALNYIINLITYNTNMSLFNKWINSNKDLYDYFNKIILENYDIIMEMKLYYKESDFYKYF
jgi:hypothetical protein